MSIKHKLFLLTVANTFKTESGRQHAIKNGLCLQYLNMQNEYFNDNHKVPFVPSLLFFQCQVHTRKLMLEFNIL